MSRHPPARASIPTWTPQQRANHEAHHARLARIREERAPERARQDARDRQDEAARTHARDARAHSPQTRTTGHRREHAARAHDPEARQRPRRTITERKRDAIADVGLYRAVSYTDLSERHFDAHPYATRRAVNHMIRARDYLLDGFTKGR